MLPLNPNNILVPAAYNGLSEIGPDHEWVDLCKTTTIVLAAGGTSFNNRVQLDKDAAYDVSCVFLSPTSPANFFSLRFADQTGHYLNDNFIASAFFFSNFGTPNTGMPFLMPLAWRFPAGSSILIDVIDRSGAGNTISIVIRGWKRYGDRQ